MLRRVGVIAGRTVAAATMIAPIPAINSAVLIP